MTTVSDLLGRRGPEVLERHIHINAKEARNNFSEIMHITDFKEKRIIITHRGKPKMALVPISDLEILEDLDKKAAAKPIGAENFDPGEPNNKRNKGGSIFTGDENDIGRGGRIQKRSVRRR